MNPYENEIILFQDGLPFTVQSSRVSTIANSQLIIRNAAVEDTGEYDCLAVSIAGQRNKNFDVNVYGENFIFGSMRGKCFV